jgi:hypothetical protein
VTTLKPPTFIRVYGASDDLIEVEGDLQEEFNPPSNRSGDSLISFLAFSDGTVLSIIYGPEGIWRINRVAHGSARYDKEEGTDDGHYSDVVTLTGEIAWVVFGSELARVKQ